MALYLANQQTEDLFAKLREVTSIYQHPLVHGLLQISPEFSIIPECYIKGFVFHLADNDQETPSSG